MRLIDKWDAPIIVHGRGPFGRPVLSARYGPHWSYATVKGGPVLKTETTWGNVNGVMIHVPWFAAWVQFRRWKIKR